MTRPVDFDAIVVGAGPAGLACAHALAGHQVLLLDREARHGGRIRTIDLGHQRVDMGACFAFDREAMPPGLVVDAGRRIEERQNMAVHDGQRAHMAATPMGCLVRMRIDATSLAQVDAVARLTVEADSLRGSRAHALLDALLHQVHPGDLLDYAPRHQRDGLFSWYPDHWEHGNGCLADALLKASGAEFLPQAEATEVIDRGDHVEVGFTHAGQAKRLRARAAVLATTADVASRLTDWQDPRARQLFDATHYASYLVVAMAGPAAPTLASFRSLVPLDGSPALVVQQRSIERRQAVLLSYFRGTDSAHLAEKTDTELVELCRSRFAQMGIEASAVAALADCAVQRWSQGGTVLSQDQLRSRAALAERQVGALFIAGDYACGADGAGYGVTDAVRSGIRAAKDLRAFLAQQGATGP